jgi:RHS repeat-associated protein
MLSAGTSTKFLVQVIGTQLEMDRFIYNYHTLNGEQSNRLNYVVDNGIDYSSYDDIKSGQTSGNYTYNKIGELTGDAQENMILHWRTGDHKLARIERTDENSPELEFVYSPFGQRVMKIEKIRANGVFTGEVKNSYYAYDANGQVMAIYELDQNSAYKLKERYLYGAERLGVNNTEVTIFENNTLTEFIHKETNVVHTDIRGRKRYFLTNHLGTVNATITDRKIYNTTDHHYEPVIVMYAETYCFGFLMPNRSFNLEESRYLLHGMEYDSEVSGTGNSYTTEFRQYDPRLGRWKSLDALMHMFPHISPYVAFANNPIYFTDPYGLEPVNDGEPEVGSTCEDEWGCTLKYDGDGKWSDVEESSTQIQKTSKTTQSMSQSLISPLKPKQNEIHHIKLNDMIPSVMNKSYFSPWKAIIGKNPIPSVVNKWIPRNGNEQCFTTACQIIYEANGFKDKYEEAGPGNGLWFAINENSNRKQYEYGKITTDKQILEQAINNIDYYLSQGFPVLVGVDWKDANYNKDKITDHFIVIVGIGYTEEGQKYYTFMDTYEGAKRGTQNNNNRLYDMGNNIYQGKPAGSKKMTYTLTCVRLMRNKTTKKIIKTN